MAEPWLCTNGIAAQLGITKDIVYTWIAEKAIPAHKVKRLWKFHASEIDTWVWLMRQLVTRSLQAMTVRQIVEVIL